MKTDILKKAMYDNDLTYRDVQELTGVGLKTLSQILNGTGSPRPKTIRALEIGLKMKKGTLKEEFKNVETSKAV